MKKKHLRLVERLKSMPARKPGPKNWLERLPADVACEVIEAKVAWRAGEIGQSGRCVAKDIHEDLVARGFKVCGSEQIRAWLSRD